MESIVRAMSEEDSFGKTDNPNVMTEEKRDEANKKLKKGGKGSAGAAKGGKKSFAARTENPAREKELNLTEEQEEAYKKLKGDDKRKFEIRQKVAENRYLDKPDQHEISLEDERFAGLVPA